MISATWSMVGVEIRRTGAVDRAVRLQADKGDRLDVVTVSVQLAATESNTHPPCQPPGTITNFTASS